jgi:D-arabinitol 4-dehydrogenase
MSFENTWLHIGLGAFHRAHQAVVLQQLHDAGDTRWGLAAGNIRNDGADTLAALAAQQGAYTLETVDTAGQRRYQRIQAIRELIPFDPALSGLIAAGARASTRLISFTVTEAGYYLDSQHRLDPSHPDLAADLAGQACRTIYGALAATLARRRQTHGAPVTLLNCDNLRSNGERFRAGLLEFLDRRGDAALRAWVEAHTSCPNAMVDRITPRPPPELAARVQGATGWADRAPVMGEAFLQWVVEDRFVAGRPAWESVGVEMVASVHAHEEAKIRVLNGTHSCIAWAGTLRGRGTIHESLALPDVRQLAFDYVTQDVIPCLNTPQPSPIDLAAYRDTVLVRFANPHLRDTNQRVAMDGYSKIPGFIVPTLREALQRGAVPAATAVLPALFFEVLARWHAGRLPYAYQDGVMDETEAHAIFAAADPLAAFAGEPLLWGTLAGTPALLALLRTAHQRVQAFIAAGP